MNIREGWDFLVGSLNEQLNRTVYSDREASQERHKHYTQITKEIDTETPYVSYDPFGLYSNSFALGGTNSLSTNHSDMIRKWREASMLPEVDEALSEITSEAIVFDEIDDAIVINLDDIELTENIKTKVRESFDKIKYLLDFNEKGEELFKQWYVDSTLNFEVVYNNRKMKDGIQKLILLPPFDIEKFKNAQDSTIRWFINKHQTYNPLKDLDNAEITYYDEQITQITSGILSVDKRCYHSPIQKAMKAINQLYLLEDSLIIMRITKSTEKRAFYVDVGNLPKTKAEEYMKNLMTKYRQKKVYNTENGTIDNASKSISVLEDFWFPVQGGSGRGTKVENLPGISQNFTDFSDVDYFINKVYSALNVPKNRRSSENRITVNPGIDIEKDEMKFFKYVQKLRRRFNNLFVDLLKKDLISRQVLSLDDWIKIQEKIKFTYATSNEISMIKKAQIMDVKINGANGALALIDPMNKILSPRYIQENILRLTDEEIQKIAEDWEGFEQNIPDALGNAAGGGGGADGGGTPAGFSEVGSESPMPDAGGGKEGADAGGGADAAEAKGPRFQQKAREAGLSQDIIDSLEDGDIITNGTQQLIYENGKLRKFK